MTRCNYEWYTSYSCFECVPENCADDDDDDDDDDCYDHLRFPPRPTQELEVMLDLFHSFDDTNTGVLKKAVLLKVETQGDSQRQTGINYENLSVGSTG